MAKFKVGDKAIIKETGEKVRVMGQKKDGLYSVTHLDGRMYGDFAEEALAANAVTSKNSVVANAIAWKAKNIAATINTEVKDSKGNTLKDGDYAVPTLGSFKGKRVKIVSIHSRANIYIQDSSGAVKIIDGQYLVKNSVATNAKFNVGDEFTIVSYPKHLAGKTARISKVSSAKAGDMNGNRNTTAYEVQIDGWPTEQYTDGQLGVIVSRGQWKAKNS